MHMGSRNPDMHEQDWFEIEVKIQVPLRAFQIWFPNRQRRQ